MDTDSPKPLADNSEASAKTGAQAAPLSEPIRVRVAVMVNPEGDWVAFGSRGNTDDGTIEEMCGDLGLWRREAHERLHFIEADLPRPHRAQGIVTRRAETAQQARGAERVEPDGEAGAPVPKSDGES